MLRTLAYVTFALTLASAVIGCSAIPPPEEITAPAAPEDVLSVWYSAPSPQGLPPSMAESLVVPIYGSSGDTGLVGSRFYIENYQWVDVIVKSEDVPIWFTNDIPSTACFYVNFEDYELSNSFMPDSEDLERDPFVGKMLYENVETHTTTGITYNTAVRLCSPYSTGYLIFRNYNVHDEVQISYEVYELDITPEWGIGGDYRNNVLVPWMKQRLGGAYKESELEELYEEWKSQFK